MNEVLIVCVFVYWMIGGVWFVFLWRLKPNNKYSIRVVACSLLWPATIIYLIVANGRDFIARGVRNVRRKKY